MEVGGSSGIIRQAAQGGYEAGLIVRLLALEHFENFTGYHSSNQPPRFIGRVAFGNKPLVCLPGFWRLAITQLIVNDFVDSGPENRTYSGMSPSSHLL
ncbi:MAG: hypothetical protein AAB658_02505 [Chloroflexota bacterium]